MGRGSSVGLSRRFMVRFFGSSWWERRESNPQPLSGSRFTDGPHVPHADSLPEGSK